MRPHLRPCSESPDSQPQLFWLYQTTVFWAYKSLEGQGRFLLFLNPSWTEHSARMAPVSWALSLTRSSVLTFLLGTTACTMKPTQVQLPEISRQWCFSQNCCSDLLPIIMPLYVKVESHQPCSLLVANSVLGVRLTPTHSVT